MTDLASPTTQAKQAKLWRNLSFTLMWTSVAASGFGDRMIQLAAWDLLGMNTPGAQVSSIQAGVTLFFFLPYIIFSPIGGYLADRLPRKWILFTCDEMRGIVMLTAVWFGTRGLLGDADNAVKPEWVHGLVFLIGVMAAIFSPTRNATVPQIVPIKQLQSANAIILGISVIASMIGLGVGGTLIERGGVDRGLQLGAALFLVSGSFFAFLKTHKIEPADIPNRPRTRFSDGVKYVLQHKRVLALILLSTLFWSAANVFLGGVAALCKLRYDIPADRLASHIAFMGMFTGIGMLTSSLWVAWIRERRESSAFALLCLLAASVCMTGVALSNSFPVGAALATATGFFGNAAMICLATLTQSVVPDRQRGRVFGIREMTIVLSSLVVNFIIWRLPNVDRIMLISLFGTAGVLAFISICGLWIELPKGPWADPGLNIVRRFGRAYMFVWHRLEVKGVHNVPAEGGVIIAANHTTGIDPFVMQAKIHRLIRWVMLTSYQFKAANFIWKRIEPIALDLDGRDTSRLRLIVNRLKDGEVVGLFPEGRLQRDSRELAPFEAGIGLIAKRGKATIVPCWISGTPLHKSMFMHFVIPSKSKCVFGEPYVPDKEMSHEEVSADLRERLIALSKTVEADT